MKIKTAQLTDLALDWAVAKCEGEVTELSFDGFTWGFKLDGQLKVMAKGWAQSMVYLPSTDWSQGGPIIERERILLEPSTMTGVPEMDWGARKADRMLRPTWFGDGPTPLIAAMRCYVASKLGKEVDVPEELC